MAGVFGQPDRGLPVIVAQKRTRAGDQQPLADPAVAERGGGHQRGEAVVHPAVDLGARLDQDLRHLGVAFEGGRFERGGGAAPIGVGAGFDQHAGELDALLLNAEGERRQAGRFVDVAKVGAVADQPPYLAVIATFDRLEKIVGFTLDRLRVRFEALRGSRACNHGSRRHHRPPAGS